LTLDAAIQVLLYALVAGLSPLAFAATLSVMPAGRPKAFVFGAGFVGAQTLTCSVLVTIGIAATRSSSKSYPGFRAAPGGRARARADRARAQSSPEILEHE
jgi:hypothetical protein